MELPGTQENTLDQEAKYFESYEVKSSDLEDLQHGIDTVADSKLLEGEVLDNIRFVTYDSKSLYIFTRGEHTSNDSPPYTFFLLNGDMELNSNREIFV